MHKKGSHQSTYTWDRKYASTWMSKIILLLIFATNINYIHVFSQPLQIPYQETPNVVIDGIISSQEYPTSFTDPTTGINVNLVHDATNLYIALSGGGDGWISIGFGPTNARMDGSNIIIGAINENTTNVIDEVGVGHGHYPDIERGGESNIIEAAGKITPALTIEFVIPLDSGDALDYKINPGSTYGFFLATNDASSDFAQIHTTFSETYQLSVEAAPTIPQTPEYNWLLLLPVAFLILLLMYSRRKRPKVYRFSELEN